jgi:cytochrome P450
MAAAHSRHRPGLLAAFDDRGSFDLIAGFAAPLPIVVIAEMLGVDPPTWRSSSAGQMHAHKCSIPFGRLSKQQS